jgi:hypothetical protein
VLLQSLARNIFNMLVDTGIIAALDKAPGAATTKTSSASDQIKPLTGNPQILFKTHKYEVRQHIAHLSNDLVDLSVRAHASGGSDQDLQP